MKTFKYFPLSLPDQYLLTCFFEKNSYQWGVENHFWVYIYIYISISRSVFKFIKRRGGVCDLPRFPILILENSVNLKHCIVCRMAFYLHFIGQILSEFSSLYQIMVKIQVFVLTLEFGHKMTLSSWLHSICYNMPVYVCYICTCYILYTWICMLYVLCI